MGQSSGEFEEFLKSEGTKLAFPTSFSASSETIEMKVTVLVLTTLVAIVCCEANNIDWYDKDAEKAYQEAYEEMNNVKTWITTLEADIKEYEQKKENARVKIERITNQINRFEGLIDRLNENLPAIKKEMRNNDAEIQRAVRQLHSWNDAIREWADHDG